MGPEKEVTIPVPLRAQGERRGAERFDAAMPVSVNGDPATTRDLSASGLSFLAERTYEPGTLVDVVIEYLLDGHHYPLRCQAEVVRVEPTADGFRIGARLAPQWQSEVALGDARAPHLRSVD